MVSHVSLLCYLYCYCLSVVSQSTMENCRRTEENCPGYRKTAEEVSQMKDLLSMVVQKVDVVVQRVDVVVQRVDDISIQNTQMQENLTAKIQQLDEKLKEASAASIPRDTSIQSVLEMQENLTATMQKLDKKLSKLAEAFAGSIRGGTKSGINGNITCDDILDVYLDGEKKIDRKEDWWTTASIAIPPGIQVLAVHCEDVNTQGGIIGSFSNGLVTDASWKCTNQVGTGWNLPAYDDSNWANAYVIGRNGNSPKTTNPTAVNVTMNAAWIWTTGWRGQHKLVYCRYTF